MSKLPSDKKFIDVSDYGRPFARAFVSQVEHTKLTPVQVTYLFGLSGIFAIYAILNEYYFAAGFFLILKSILDAADGELARVKKTPSYTGRYLDSIFDIVLNFLLFITIWSVSSSSILATLVAFVSVQLQGTLYNYYYVVLRHNTAGGEQTSKIIEDKSPKALPGESQRTVNWLFNTYNILYGAFDKAIFNLDRNAVKTAPFPNWFMSIISIYGLGFQLLIISAMLTLGMIDFIIPFFIAYSILLLVFIGIRKIFLREVVSSKRFN